MKVIDMRFWEKAKNDTRGESLIVVIVLMLVFFTIGATLLTSSSSAYATANERRDNKQTYYYARSTLDTIDESIMNGKLGQAVRTSMLNKLTSSGKDSYTAKDESEPLSVSLSGDGGSDFTIENATIKYSGTAVATAKDAAGAATGAMVALQDVTVSFDAAHSGKTYTMSATYSYSGWATKTGANWGWNEQWSLENAE